MCWPPITGTLWQRISSFEHFQVFLLVLTYVITCALHMLKSTSCLLCTLSFFASLFPLFICGFLETKNEWRVSTYVRVSLSFAPLSNVHTEVYEKMVSHMKSSFMVIKPNWCFPTHCMQEYDWLKAFASKARHATWGQNLKCDTAVQTWDLKLTYVEKAWTKTARC